MIDSPERDPLRTLSLCFVKALCKMDRFLSEYPDSKRDNKIRNLIKELEVCNDEVLRNHLGMDAQQIAKLKTGRAPSTRKKSDGPPSQPRIQTPFQQLMEHHAKNIVGPIPDAAAQGSAIKWILQSFTPDLAIKRYNSQMEQSQSALNPWRVSWLTVRRDIGRIQTNGSRMDPTTNRNADNLRDNLFVEDLRGEAETDYH